MSSPSLPAASTMPLGTVLVLAAASSQASRETRFDSRIGLERGYREFDSATSPPTAMRGLRSWPHAAYPIPKPAVRISISELLITLLPTLYLLGRGLVAFEQSPHRMTTTFGAAAHSCSLK